MSVVDVAAHNRVQVVELNAVIRAEDNLAVFCDKRALVFAFSDEDFKRVGEVILFLRVVVCNIVNCVKKA